MVSSGKAINPFIRQRDFNRASRPNWTAFSAHRARVADLLTAAGGGDSLCILGAGNCNDLDLNRLLACWRRIRLVDVDAEAMQAGIDLQQIPDADRPRLEPTACDLTGALEHCHELSHSPTSSAALARLRAALSLTPAPAQIGERFSMVASTCLLSQLADVVRHALGPDHPDLPELAALVRLQHLRTLADLANQASSRILLLADFVSSDTLPALLHAPEAALRDLMDHALQHGNCFTAMNLHAICRALNSPPFDSLWTAPARPSPPWRWNLGPRIYLVSAIEVQQKSGNPSLIIQPG